MRGGVAAR
ncbi:hypothetical protein EYF80_060149 [Liparis tanakae]|uniref:Uncharacterized protein n=1 Tax=Liparis tanakae TaxID=230148 RepID=A0A4Z2EMV0_9TELE|nr:hypothetical protein EYF80_060149 [Liparis tanakae]